MILKKVLVHLGWILSCRAVGLHSVFVDLDPDRALFLNADPNPAVQNCFVTFKLCKKVPYEEFAHHLCQLGPIFKF